MVGRGGIGRILGQRDICVKGVNAVGVDDANHTVLAMLASILGAIEDERVRIIDRDAKDIGLFGLSACVSTVSLSSTHIWTALGSREEAGEETSTGGWNASSAPGSLDNAVVPGPETKLQDVSLGNDDVIWGEGEAESSHGDRNDSCVGLPGQGDCRDEAGQHHDEVCDVF